MIQTLLATPLTALGIILLAGALLGDATERIKVPWITGCIVAGIVLGPQVGGVFGTPDLAALDGFAQASLAVIAFNIGCQLSLPKLKAVGRSTAILAVAQLLAPLLLVLGAEPLIGLSIPAALLMAGVAPATAPTTTYSVIRRREATGLFVDRALGILAINDAATVLIFSVASAATVATLGAQSSGALIGDSLRAALLNEALSVGAGLVLGAAYLLLRRLIEDGTPGWQPRLTATLFGLLLLGIGAAIAFRLSHLLVPLSFGVVIANGAEEAERARAQSLVKALEEPLFIIFFVIAGAHLPLDAALHAAILLGACVYLAARFAGKYGAVFLGASLLRLDSPTRRYLGLCFPSQGGLAIGLVLALNGSPAVHALPPAAAAIVEQAISVVLVGVLLSQVAGPVVIDWAVRRGVASQAAEARTAAA
ncbi:MAG: cation:proton antiporter [Proteobacteria bacterium]|nr:cation:proton antiporter [Pseudomonadota bacterium]